MMEVGASPPDADVLIYPRPTPTSPPHTSHNSPRPRTDACRPPRPILTRPLLPPDQGCREILSTSGPFTVLAPLVSSRTMNVSPRLLPGPAPGCRACRASPPPARSGDLALGGPLSPHCLGGVAQRGPPALGPLGTPSLCPQASVAQQLCRQHIIAGQHMLEEAGSQAPRRWWTLAGQEITVSFSRFRVSRGLVLGTRGVTGGEYSPGGGVEVDRALGQGVGVWSLSQ